MVSRIWPTRSHTCLVSMNVIAHVKELSVVPPPWLLELSVINRGVESKRRL
jgi:hypothetical protein